MKGPEIRSHYPQQWLLVEAIAAHSEGNKRILDEIAVIETFPDSRQGLQHHQQLHRVSPERELYVFHTSRKGYTKKCIN